MTTSTRLSGRNEKLAWKPKHPCSSLRNRTVAPGRETHFPFSFFTGSLRQSNRMQGEAGASFSSAFKLLASEYAQTALTSTGAPLLAPGFPELESHSRHKENPFPGTFEQTNMDWQIFTKQFKQSALQQSHNVPHLQCVYWGCNSTVSVCITAFGPQSRAG